MWESSSIMAGDSSVKLILGKLGHPLPEVRFRSLRSLRLKLDHGLLHLRDAAEEEYLLRQLLEWFNREGCQHEDEVLDLLLHMAEQRRAHLLLCDLGAVEFLESLRAHSSARLHPHIDKLAAVLLSRPQESSSEPIQSSSKLASSQSHASRGHSYRPKEPSSQHIGGNQDRGVNAASCGPVGPTSMGQAQCSNESAKGGAPSTGGKKPVHEHTDHLKPQERTALRRTLQSVRRTGSTEEEALPELWLPEVPLSPSDDQYLFEINLKLQCTADPRVMRVALRELTDHVVHDFLPEALLQKHNILENVLSLAHPVGSSGDLDTAALDFLAILVTKIREALDLADDPSYQLHLEDDSDQPSTSYSNKKDTAGYLRSSYPVSKKQKKSPAEPAPTPHRKKRQLGERVVDISQHIHMMVVHLLKLLIHESRLEKMVPLLRNLLPLLQPKEMLDTKARVRFAQYFHIIADAFASYTDSLPSNPLVLLTAVRLREEANLSSAAAALPPPLVVLSIACNLVQLLPKESAKEVVPASLVEAISALAVDEVLASCVTGVREDMLPYLALLDPKAYDELVQAQSAYASSKTVGTLLLDSPDEAFSKSRTLAALNVLLQAVPSLAVSEDAAAARQFIMLVKRILTDEVTTKGVEEAGSQSSHRSEGNAHAQQERGPATQSTKERDTKSETGLPTDDKAKGVSAECETAVKDGSEKEQVVKLAREVVLQLLTHESATIRRVGYEALLEASKEAKGQQTNTHSEAEEQEFLERVVRSDQVMVEILTRGLHHETTAKQAAELFLHFVKSTPPSERLRFASARPWLSCCLDLAEAASAAFMASGLITRSLDSAVTRAQIQNAAGESAEEGGGKESSLEWEELSKYLMGLFSKNEAVRKESAAAVRECLKGLGQVPPADLFEGLIIRDTPSSRRVEEDPFYELLVDLLPSKNETSHVPKEAEKLPEGLPAFKKQDAEKLLAIVRSSHVEDAIRRSALEQLRAASQDQRLEALLAKDERFLELLVFETVRWSQSWGSPLDSLEAAEREVRGEERGFGVLGMSALSLLGQLSSSSAARKWLLAERTARIYPLLPLIFHPSAEVRQHVGALLTALLFSSAGLLMSLSSAAPEVEVTLFHLTPKGTGDLLPGTSVPLPFLTSYSFPCPVMGAQVGCPFPENSGGKKHLEVKRLLEQMSSMEGGASEAWQRLERKRRSGVPLTTTEQQAFAIIPCLNPDRVFETTLQGIQDAKSNEDCACLLGSLSLHVLQHPLRARALAKAPWPPAFQRFLSVPPVTTEDRLLACQVLEHVLRMLQSGGLSSAGLLLLAKMVENVSIPLLTSGWKGKASFLSVEGSNEASSGRNTTGVEKGDLRFEGLLLELVTKVLTAGAESSCHVAGQICSALLSSTGLVGLLLTIASGPQGSGGLRCTAVQGLERVAALVARVNGEAPLKEGICSAVVPLVNLVISLSGEAKEGAPQQKRALLRAALYSLRAILASCEHNFWDRAWASTEATFWLSRLSRHSEASIRASAFALTAFAAGASEARHMLASCWPEVAHVVTKAALDERECYAVRQEALRVVSKLRKSIQQNKKGADKGAAGADLRSESVSAFEERTTAEAGSSGLGRRGDGSVEKEPILTEIVEGSLDIEEASFEDSTASKSDDLGLNKALRQREFWEKLPGLFLEKGATNGFLRMLTSLLVAWGPEADLLKVPSMWPFLTRLLRFDEETGLSGKKDCAKRTLLDKIAIVGHIAQLIARVGHFSSEDRALLLDRLSVLPALAACFSNLSDSGASSQSRSWVFAEERAVGLESLAVALGSVVYWKGAESLPFEDRNALRSLAKAAASLLTEQAVPKGGESKSEGRNADSVLATRVKLAVCKLLVSLLRDGLAAAAMLEEASEQSKNDPSPQNATAQIGAQAGLGAALCEKLLPLYQYTRQKRNKAMLSGAPGKAQLCNEALAASAGALRSLLAFSRDAKAYAVEKDLPGKLLEYARDTLALLRLESLRMLLPNQGPPRQHRPAAVTVTSSSRKGAPAQRKAPQKKVAQDEKKQEEAKGQPLMHGSDGWGEPVSAPLLEDLLLSLNLLKHLAYKNEEAAEAVLDAGALSLVQDTWNYAQAETAVLHELLGLLCNLAAASDAARRAIASEGQAIVGGGGGKATGNKGVIMLGMVKLLGRPSLGLSLFKLAMQLMQSLVMGAAARTALLRTSFLIDAQQSLQRAVNAKDLQRQDAILDVLANLAAFPDGQRALLKSLALAGLFDMVLDVAASGSDSPAASALLLLRNLAFAHENKVHFLSNPRALPLLLTAVTLRWTAGTAHQVALASSALWALLYNDQRVLAALRMVDALPLLERALRSLPLKEEIGHEHHAREALKRIIQLMG